MSQQNHRHPAATTPGLILQAPPRDARALWLHNALRNSRGPRQDLSLHLTAMSPAAPGRAHAGLPAAGAVLAPAQVHKCHHGPGAVSPCTLSAAAVEGFTTLLCFQRKCSVQREAAALKSGSISQQGNDTLKQHSGSKKSGFRCRDVSEGSQRELGTRPMGAKCKEIGSYWHKWKRTPQ